MARARRATSSVVTSGIIRVPPADISNRSWSITTTASRPTDSSRISITRDGSASMESSTDMPRTLADSRHVEVGLAAGLHAEGPAVVAGRHGGVELGADEVQP